jgi:hypothetical protein
LAETVKSEQPKCPCHPREDDQVERGGGAQEEQDVPHLPCWPKEILEPMKANKEQLKKGCMNEINIHFSKSTDEAKDLG